MRKRSFSLKTGRDFGLNIFIFGEEKAYVGL
jgi:hypothetical protein